MVLISPNLFFQMSYSFEWIKRDDNDSNNNNNDNSNHNNICMCFAKFNYKIYLLILKTLETGFLICESARPDILVISRDK